VTFNFNLFDILSQRNIWGKELMKRQMVNFANIKRVCAFKISNIKSNYFYK